MAIGDQQNNQQSNQQQKQILIQQQLQKRQEQQNRPLIKDQSNEVHAVPFTIHTNLPRIYNENYWNY